MELQKDCYTGLGPFATWQKVEKTDIFLFLVLAIKGPPFCLIPMARQRRRHALYLIDAVVTGCNFSSSQELPWSVRFMTTHREKPASLFQAITDVVLSACATAICALFVVGLVFFEPHWPLKYVHPMVWSGVALVLLVAVYGWTEVIRRFKRQPPLLWMPLGALSIVITSLMGVLLIAKAPKMTADMMVQKDLREIVSALEQFKTETLTPNK